MPVENISIVEVRQGPVGPAGTNGSDATVTAENVALVLNDALAADPTGAWDSIESGADVQGAGDLVNSQPNCLAKISAWNTSAMPPLRGAVMGDSLAFLGPLQRGPFMADAGSIGRGYGSGTGSITDNTSDFSRWFTGITTTFAVGASAQFSCGDALPTYRRGNKLVIYYIKQSGGGTFDIQYESASAVGTWVAATGGTGLSAANATTIGAAFVADLPTSNTPSYKIRINNVATGPVTIIGAGIYHSTGGGCVMIKDLLGKSGLDLSAITVPSAVYTPIYTDLAPDFILSCWADGTDGASAPWDSGGAFRTWYSNFRAIKSTTDWIQISANPAVDETYFSTVRASQRAWAVSSNQTYINGHAMFRSYANANALGLMADTVHLSSTGGIFRNNVLWSKLPLGQTPLGGFYNYATGSEQSPFLIRGIGDFGENPVEFSPVLFVSGSTAALELADQVTPLNLGLRGRLYVSSGSVYLATSNSLVNAIFPVGSSGFAGMSPPGAGYKLGGFGGFNWDANLRNTVNTGTLTYTPDAQTATTAAVSILTASTALTTTAPAQAITLANGANGQIKTIAHVASSGGGTAVLTPATKTGYTTITFTSTGETATLQYFNTVGWLIIGLRGAVAA